MPPKKILAIKLRALGDTVLMTAPLIELRRAYPQAEIHVAVSSAWAPLLEAHPAVNRVWVYERYRETAARAKAAARLALRLRKERFDMVANFHASPSSSMIAFATGAPLRAIHFHGHRDKNRYSTLEIAGKGALKPIIERDMDTIRALGIQVPEGRLPRVFLTPEENQAARRWLIDRGLAGQILGIGLGASRPTKSWPTARYAELAVRWARETGNGVLALADKGEGELVDQFQAAVRKQVDAFVSDPAERDSLLKQIQTENHLSIRKLAGVLGRLSVYCGNDSGPKHIAVAVGTPTVTLFGPEHPFEWHPYPPAGHPYFFVESLACRRDADPGMPPWCGLHACVEEKHRCMLQTEATPVLAECRRIASAAESR